MAKSDEKVIDAKKILRDFQRAYEAKKKWLKQAEEDFQFALGKQWDDDDVEKLSKVGVRALTINKIRPNIFLLTGLESQNRTDYQAYPEGGEDSLVANIVTSLLKNSMKTCDGDYRVSEQFENGLTCGECYMEPYLDYSYDMINPKLKLKAANFFECFPEPGFQMYDLSDAEYFCKIKFDLSKDKLLQIFPDKEKEIDDTPVGKIDLQEWGNLRTLEGMEIQRKGYNKEDDVSVGNIEGEEPLYDLVEYYYKKYVKKYYVAKKGVGLKEVIDDTEADRTIEIDKQTDTAQGRFPMKKITKYEPEIWCAALVGSKVLDNSRCWTYPKWKSYPFIPYFTYRSTQKLKDPELLVQGIVRGLKDPQREVNKRRTQTLRILNTSANSGWISAKGVIADKDAWKDFASSAGVILEYELKKATDQRPEKILPTPLSQGHEQMAQEASDDLKAISGINADLLAMSDKAVSGVAIGIRQRQGMVMVQKIFDNLSQTKRLLGRFILSIFSEIYDVESAIRVLGDQFIKDSFSVPVMQPQPDPMTGQMKQMPVMKQDGSGIEMQLDEKLVQETMNNVLSNSGIGVYDVSVGESASNETTKYANFMVLMDMASKYPGVIPPEVLVGESLISESSKQKITDSIEAQKAAMANNPPQQPPA